MIAPKSRLAAALVWVGVIISADTSLAMSELEKRGRVLTVRLCAQCHAIGKTDASHSPAALTLRRMEQRGINLDTFASRLRQGQMSGHYDMPEFRFGREDARALVAYLRMIQGP